MAIYLVRHGETNGNANRIVQTPSTPLSSKGEQQAQQFADAYSSLPISCILSSDYARAYATALALHSKLGSQVIGNELLRERSFGDLRGLAYSDIGHDIMAPDYHPPNGESHATFMQRVANAWTFVTARAAREEGDLLVVTHGLVLRCLFSEIFALPNDTLNHIDIQNTCVTKVSGPYYNHIDQLCDVSHLVDDALQRRE